MCIRDSTGSMNDPYMPLEKQMKLTGGALEIIAKHRFPVHVITKSSLVTRDGALRRLEDGGQQEREEQAQAFQRGGMGGDEVDQIGGGDHLAQHADRGGHEQDGSDGLEVIINCF